MKLRPEVQAFAELMEENLRKHDAPRGPRGWRTDGAASLRRRLRDELAELDDALLQRQDDGWPDWHGPAIAKEAADVANFAMMIADVCGGLLGGDDERA